MTYKEMSKELKEIAKTYNRSLQDLIVNGAQIKEGFLFDPSKRNDEYAFFQFKWTNSSTINAERFVLSVNFALTCLKTEYRTILWHDYFRKAENGWWISYFSKTSYYRNRREAVKEFMEIKMDANNF